MTRVEQIIRKYEPGRGKCPVTAQSTMAAVLWALVSAAIIIAFFHWLGTMR
ncbi:MAG TPA: hypothetical protein VFN81_08700 [Sphingomicrobium sp.]|nr:hypothetical protein [Sphingomicrobium sp.]